MAAKSKSLMTKLWTTTAPSRAPASFAWATAFLTPCLTVVGGN
jgi:hypothetical protein